MRPCPEVTAPAASPVDRARPAPAGTWTLDPGHSVVAYARRVRRLRSTTGRLHAWGVVHLDELPPAGVIRFEQPSGLPVLTMALDAAEVAGDGSGDRWWLLRSDSLEVLPTGAWRVMATLTATGAPTRVELHLDARARGPDRLVLRGQGVLDAGGRLDLALLARRVTGTGVSSPTGRGPAARATPWSAAWSGRPRPAARP
jgi:hypothetical protein